jgi:hypothetical protein
MIFFIMIWIKSARCSMVPDGCPWGLGPCGSSGPRQPAWALFDILWTREAAHKSLYAGEIISAMTVG